MAYDPADLRLPRSLLALLNAIVRIRLPVWPGWRLGVARPGALYVTAMMGVWSAALYSGNNLLYLCGSMLLMLAVAALAVAVLLLARMPLLAADMPDLGAAGSAGIQHRPLLFSFPFAACVDVQWGKDMPCSLRCTHAGSRLLLCLPDLPRGLYTFDRQRLSTEAPLGMWHLQRVRSEFWQWTVLPAPVAWTGTGLSTGQGIAGYREGDEWHDLRAYVRGDSLSRIHWRKAVADEWTVKRFSDSSAEIQAHLLRVDLRGPAGGSFERLLGQACFWMRSCPDGQLVLGSRQFNLADPKQKQMAWRALAAAGPEKMPPVGQGGVILSLWEERRAA